VVVPEFSIANTSLVNPQLNPYMNSLNLKRSPNTAVNIQHGRLLSQSSSEGPHSPSLSPMDSFPPSKMDYATRIEDNNMEVEEPLLL